MSSGSTVNPMPDAVDLDERPAIDVSDLPISAFGARHPTWWGNTLLIFIESMTLLLLLASYFYIRRNFETFPPPKVETVPPIGNTSPALGWGTLNLALILLSCLPMAWTHRASWRMERAKILTGLAVMFAISAATIWVRFKEFPATNFWWNDNAYASVVWALLGTHLTYLIAAAVEFGLMGVWILLHPLDEDHAVDVTLAGIYWYWIGGTWLVVYAVVYFGPRVL